MPRGLVVGEVRDGLREGRGESKEGSEVVSLGRGSFVVVVRCGAESDGNMARLRRRGRATVTMPLFSSGWPHTW